MGKGRERQSTSVQLSLGMYACQRWGLKFSDESYIGNKNKSHRPIGSYKRSKSAAVLPSSTVASGESEPGYPDKKLSQSTWNSEWTLQSHATSSSLAPPSQPQHQDLTSRLSPHDSLHNHSEGQDAPPVRPARPNALSRQNVANHNSSMSSPAFSSQPVAPASSSSSSSLYRSPNSSSHYPPDSSTAAGTPVFTARPFVIAGPQGVSHENSPRRAPPPVPDSPPFDLSKASPLSSPPQSSSSSTPSSLSSMSSSSPMPMYIVPSSSSSTPPSLLTNSHRQWQSPENITPSYASSTSQGLIGSHQQSSHSLAPSSHHHSSTTPASIATHNGNVLKPSNLPNTATTTTANAAPSAADNIDSPPALPPPRDYHQNRRDSEPLKPNSYNPVMTSPGQHHQPQQQKRLHQSFLHRPISEGSGLNLGNKENTTNGGLESGDGSIPSPSGSCHSRQPSQEELECDLKAKQLAENLGDRDVKLSGVLSLDAKKRMRYLDGLFHAQNGEPGTEMPAIGVSTSLSQEPVANSGNAYRQRPDNWQSGPPESDSRPNLPKEYWMSAPKAQVEMTLRHNQEASLDLVKDIKDGPSLVRQKEELLNKLRKKLDVLKDDKAQLEQEIEENNTLGVKVDSMLATKFVSSPSVVDKYHAYVDDLDKIVQLLLNLSGQLARAENAVEAIPLDADAKVKKLTTDKRDRLHAKHQEAKQLKADIDQRKDQVSDLVRTGLAPDEWHRYTTFITKKPQLAIEMQEMEDKIKLGTEQVEELKKSIPAL